MKTTLQSTRQIELTFIACVVDNPARISKHFAFTVLLCNYNKGLL
jgi:hypothetical protein